jgi:hypothetical protein
MLCTKDDVLDDSGVKSLLFQFKRNLFRIMMEGAIPVTSNTINGNSSKHSSLYYTVHERRAAFPRYLGQKMNNVPTFGLV